MKKRLLAVIFAAFIAATMTACGGGSDAKDVPPSQIEALKNGTYTLPESGVEVQYSDGVRDDKTGRWRMAKVADTTPTNDYVLEYYHEMFRSDDEVHFIINFTLNTTTVVRCEGGEVLYVDTHERVDKEELYADDLGGGMFMGSEIYDIKAGKPLDIDD